jgi:hypothetical protein
MERGGEEDKLTSVRDTYCTSAGKKGAKESAAVGRSCARQIM